MEVIATDRPGILSQIVSTMRFCGVQLQNAKVATFGERVEDIFYITDSHDRPVEDPLKLECLRYFHHHRAGAALTHWPDYARARSPGGRVPGLATRPRACGGTVF